MLGIGFAAWLHLGFNRDEAGGRVHDGMWPIIAGRRIALNFLGPSPTACWSCIRPAAKGRSGGRAIRSGARAVAEGFLLAPDAEALIRAAQTSAVLR